MNRKQKLRENQLNQNWPFEKIKKIIKSLARVIKKKKTQISNIMSKSVSLP